MSRYTNAASIFSGVPPQVSEVSPSHNLGTKMETSDGRTFRYVKAGTSALAVGDLIQSSAEDTAVQGLTPAVTAAGATTLTTTSTVTVTVDEYAGGYVIVTITPGLGQILRIKSHAAATAAAVTLTLEDPVQVALTATSRIDLVRDPYNGVIQNPATASSSPVGVAVNDITAAYYGWIQTGGIASVKAQGALTVGNLVVASNGTAGAIENAVNASTEAQAPVGIAITGVATTDCGAVKLILD